MRTHKKFLFLAALVVAQVSLTGCALSPSLIQAATPLVSQLLQQAAAPTPAAGQATQPAGAAAAAAAASAGRGPIQGAPPPGILNFSNANAASLAPVTT